MSYAVFFGVLSAACLVGALAALWGSLRAAFGGEGGGTIASAADAPERAALLDEKASLLRAIKDLQYEHQVGKLDRADFERLDRAYRARAKEVLELLDRDVRPYRARAEELLASAVPAGASASSESGRGPGKKAKKKGASVLSGAAAPSGEALVGKLDALRPEMRAAAEAFLAKLAEEASASEAAAASEVDESDEADEAESDASATAASEPTRSEDDEADQGDEEADEDDGDNRRGKAGT